MRTASIPVTTLLALVALAPACVDDGDDASIATRGQFCDVARQVDEQFQTADAGAEDFAASRALYADIVDDIERLEHALEHVDDDARDAVEASLAGAKGIAALMADAADAEAATEAAEAFFAEAESSEAEDEVAAAWLLDNCDVDIDG